MKLSNPFGLLAAPAVAILIGLTAAGGGLLLERYDPLCAACHTQPETMYYKRSIDTQTGGVDLASFHRQKAATRCIDCHGGVGAQARLATLLLAAGDTAQFILGQYEQPAKMNDPLPNPNCRQCHDEAVVRAGFENHFHNLMDEPEAPLIFCVACHVSHQEGEERAFFIREDDVFPSCNRCHDVMGGPSRIQ